MRKPDFFIIGAPKCGTTAMCDYLGQHPDIFMPDFKEPHFFGSDFSSPYFIRDEGGYLELFRDARDDQVVGEASVWYLYSELAAAQIKAYCPAARVIAMLRNPADMMYALHSQSVFTGREDIGDFADALDAEEDRRQGRRLPKGSVSVHPKGLLYRDVAKYTVQLERYIRVFGRGGVHVIIYDDFAERPLDVYDELLRFLGVGPHRPQLRIVNANKELRSARAQSFIRNPPHLAKAAARIVPARIRRAVGATLVSLNSEEQPRASMDRALRRRLQDEFLPEVERLSALLGRDVTHWCREARGA